MAFFYLKLLFYRVQKIKKTTTRYRFNANGTYHFEWDVRIIKKVIAIGIHRIDFPFEKKVYSNEYTATAI
ncbi:hypothetical protein MY04_4561 [Flammeovirga sp. MY04]|uniref:hypothetical protein n=1 Tax=Flammeovirga sp. MY04 TaxID=1191459 RepID=UPI0008060B56|nr:hypothetical protein [Flammeovirga sp. MY04]ANQ51896.1 hypothetical protein MY04_4561 [Flammeovirga sp. MY04]